MNMSILRGNRLRGEGRPEWTVKTSPESSTGGEGGESTAAVDDDVFN
jgi:hypothetical protein